MDRRIFIKGLAASAVTVATAAHGAMQTDIDARRIPRWRGFNLQGRFGTAERPYNGRAFDEFDFATMAEWGFDFARLPLSYWVWGRKDDWSVINEGPLKEIDRAVDLGRQYGL